MEKLDYKDNIMEKDVPSIKLKDKNSKNHYLIGIILGLCIIWSFGLTGFILYVVGAFLGTWITNKMLNGPKKAIKVVFWILFFSISIIGLLVRGSFTMDHNKYLMDQYLKEGDSNFAILQTDKNSENSEIIDNLYRNKKYHFRIKFPKGWRLDVGDGIHIIQKASFEDSVISIMVQQFDLGGENILSIKDVINLEEFVDTSFNGVKEKFSDAKIINYGETRIDNEPTYWIEYSASAQVLDYQIKMTNLVYYIVKGDIMYIIDAGAITDNYSDVKSLFLKSVSTFVLENY